MANDFINLFFNFEIQKHNLFFLFFHLFYLQRENLNVFPLNKDVKWFDTGDAVEMLEASNYVHKYQKKEKTLVGSIELDAYISGWISKKQFKLLINQLPNSNYKLSLKRYI